MKLKTLFILFSLSITSTFSQWILQTSEFIKPVSKIYFINEMTGWVSISGDYMFAGTGGFAMTTNGGNNWQTLPLASNKYEDFYFINGMTGWLASYSWFDTPPFSYGFIQKTTNAGSNFISQIVDTGGAFYSVSFINSNTGWVCGNYSSIYKTTNGGDNWLTVIDSNTSGIMFKKIYFENNDSGFAFGHNSILKTVNSGYNWVVKHNLTGANYINTLSVVGANLIFAGASNGLILKSTNRGETWQQQNTQTNRSIRSIYFVNNNTGFAVGGDDNSFARVILKTTNNGINWFTNISGNNHGLNSVYFINENTGWVAGGESQGPYGIGVVYKTTNAGNTIGVNQISSEIPEVFSLSQNFPNPFNPTTNIKFDIPKQSFIKLVIYDMLGREITSLVNEQLKAGTYQADWDATAFPSGVYFYKIETESFIETKKMILIK